MTPPSLQRIDLAAGSPVPVCLNGMTAVCPFIEPAASAGLLYACEIATDCQTAADIHPRLFEQLIPVIERFRDDRLALAEKQQRLLICHTVILRMPAALDPDTARLLTWPNWLGWAIKQLYTPKEIVFGFVRKNVTEKSTLGASLPVAPFHAIIIRSRVVGSDHRFFKGNQPMLDAMMEADDDGQNAHAVVPGERVDIRDPQAIRSAGYFNRVCNWGQSILPKR